MKSVTMLVKIKTRAGIRQVRILACEARFYDIVEVTERD